VTKKKESTRSCVKKICNRIIWNKKIIEFNPKWDFFCCC